MSSFFKKIGSGIQTAFKKAPGVIQSAFRKGTDLINKVPSIVSQGSSFAKQLSHGLGGVSSGLANAARIGTQVLESPFATAVASGFGPEGLAAQVAARKLLGAASKGSALANQASHLTDASSYKSGGGLTTTLENLHDARKRAQELRDHSEVPSHVFA